MDTLSKHASLGGNKPSIRAAASWVVPWYMSSGLRLPGSIAQRWPRIREENLVDAIQVTQAIQTYQVIDKAFRATPHTDCKEEVKTRLVVDRSIEAQDLVDAGTSFRSTAALPLSIIVTFWRDAIRKMLGMVC